MLKISIAVPRDRYFNNRAAIAGRTLISRGVSLSLLSFRSGKEIPTGDKQNLMHDS